MGREKGRVERKKREGERGERRRGRERAGDRCREKREREKNEFSISISIPLATKELKERGELGERRCVIQTAMRGEEQLPLLSYHPSMILLLLLFLPFLIILPLSSPFSSSSLISLFYSISFFLSNLLILLPFHLLLLI